MASAQAEGAVVSGVRSPVFLARREQGTFRDGPEGNGRAWASLARTLRKGFWMASTVRTTTVKVQDRNSTKSRNGEIGHSNGSDVMDSVFILWHCHGTESDGGEKLIGVYKTRQDAEAAIGRLKDKPGFRDAFQGFEIHDYLLGRDGWTEGYISEAEAMREAES
jgi:hypothetical protein